MTKVEAPTLEEAYEIAAAKLSCSVTELQYEVVQYPTKGILGLFKKSAIIVATREHPLSTETNTQEQLPDVAPDNTLVSQAADEIIAVVKEEASVEPEEEKELSSTISQTSLESNEIVDSFFEAEHKECVEEAPISDDIALAQTIEESLKHLMEISCFDIDVVEVDVVDNTALIFIDGEDAALLIGKEGYRYNAFSYMLYNWLYSKYQLYVKLEIAAFITTQQEMIRSYIQPVIETVKEHGRGKTRFLDGILVQIALEQLREVFPDKYVAVKTAKSGKKFVVINEFLTKKDD